MATSADEIYPVNQRRSNDEEDISLQNDFCVFVSESNMCLWDLKDNKIQCRRVEKASNVEEYVRYVEHMKNIHKHIFGSPRKDPHPLKRDFADTIHYFQNTQPKKKLFCRNKDYYLVKKYFTEGVQYVNQGEMHAYKAIARPLDIYVSNIPLEPKTFRSHYDAYTISERILPGQTKNIPANSCYIVIAPCHAFFKKVKVGTPGVGNSALWPSFATEGDFQVMSVAEDRSGSTSSEGTNQAEELSMLYTMSTLTHPSGRENEHDNSRHSLEIERVNEPDMVNDSASEGTVENDGQSTSVKHFTPLPRASGSHMEVAFVPPSPNSLKDEMELISNIQARNDTGILNRCRTVYAIRKDSNIESYSLRSNSTFRILQDNKLTGSFAIENEDMDPNVIEYFGNEQFIREIAKFKNGSMLQTALAVQDDLLKELQDPTKKKEKVVVNYFFECAFKTVEATYKKFSEMRNLKMIGSCVPAIVPLSDAIFCGAVSDAYETKP